MTALLLTILRTFNQIFTAGIAITAFSLLLYALSFNLRDRVARSFALILSCVTVVFTGEALSTVAISNFEVAFWLRFEWVGIAFLPAAYFHFSDALLEKTGRPSRGRRRLAVRIAYLISTGFLVTLPFSLLVGPLVPDGLPTAYLQRTPLTWVFTFFYLFGIGWAWFNFYRAYRRAVLPSSYRRMQYLLLGALAPALGSFPYLLFGPTIAAGNQILFWLAAGVGNVFVTVLLVVMAYSVAFFGVPWPDRVVKRRLFKWLMRGPVTASTVLALTTSLRRLGENIGGVPPLVVPLAMVVTVLFMEHMITLAAPFWERYLFQGGDRDDLLMIQTLEERMLTSKDLRQFLDAVLAAACDQVQVADAFLAAFTDENLEFVMTVGDSELLPEEALSPELLQNVTENGQRPGVFSWGPYWLMPLLSQDGNIFLGLLGVSKQDGQTLDEDQKAALLALAGRAALALDDRYRQRQLFSSLKELTPQVELIQRLRAAAQYDKGGVLSELEAATTTGRFTQTVKDALSHYWGGPKLTQSPLLGLEIVQRALEEHDDNPVNALRSILRMAIERVRPEGDRRFTAEWILYNILELKFMQGRKVREIALRLAMSEADLYRKQRVAIEAVAEAVLDMEKQARESALAPDGVIDG